MTVLLVSMVIYVLISHICYVRGVSTMERERQEMLQGVQRKQREPFAKRCRWIPLVNISPLFPFLYRHFFVIEYKIRPAVFLLIFLFVARLLYDGVCILLWSLFLNVYFYYSLKLIGVYFLGIIISSVELRDHIFMSGIRK